LHVSRVSVSRVVASIQTRSDWRCSFAIRQIEFILKEIARRFIMTCITPKTKRGKRNQAEADFPGKRFRKFVAGASPEATLARPNLEAAIFFRMRI